MTKEFQKKISSFITVDNQVLSGRPVFKGSRVPVYLVLDYFAKNWSIDDISRKFPTVQKEYVTMLISAYSEVFKSNDDNKKKAQLDELKSQVEELRKLILGDE